MQQLWMHFLKKYPVNFTVILVIITIVSILISLQVGHILKQKLQLLPLKIVVITDIICSQHYVGSKN